MDTAVQRDSVSLALLVLLERLTPAERAVFVLREAFGYSHRDIAAILDLSEANCRQLHRRARQRLAEATSRFHPARGQWRDLVDRFIAAAALRRGDHLAPGHASGRITFEEFLASRLGARTAAEAGPHLAGETPSGAGGQR
jgi:Sigma-70, region 4